MKISDLNTDTAILAELGQRIARARIDRQMTQAQLAKAAGVSKSTVERLENGASVQLTNLIRCLRALDKTANLESLLPDTPTNPITLLERQGKAPQRARPAKPAPAKPWRWDDES
ncbi:MAG: DNA-binding protein [Gammaproteobacteria bacterium BRH_c0]|nr:MAG: DNA-binding protein [Gammaproteobacteria bacterium BRH_c0]